MNAFLEILVVILYFIIDCVVSFGAPILACKVGTGFTGTYGLGNGVEVILILNSLILMTIVLAIITQAFVSVIGRAGRWIFMITLLGLNVAWVCYSINGLIETSKASSESEHLGETLFGCYLASLVFSLLKFTTYGLLVFGILVEAF